MNEKEQIFRKYLTLETVAYCQNELAWEKEKKFLDDLEKACKENGVQLLNLNQGNESLKEILQTQKIHLETTLLITTCENWITQAKNLPVAVAVPVDASENSCCQKADMLIEGFEEIDLAFLDRIMKRKQKLPWITVITPRCILREITLGDLDALYEIYAEPGITDFTEPLYESRGEEEEYTRHYIEKMYGFYGYGMWVVTEKQTGQIIGRAGFAHQDLGKEIVLEMGYLIAKPWQRKGIATEVIQKLLQFARKNLEFEEIHCFVYPQNTASEELLEKLGFQSRETVIIKGKKMQDYWLQL